MYAFQYHIPSAMPADRWNTLHYPNSNLKWAAIRAVVVHFRGSDYPNEVEVMIRKGSGKNAKVKAYRCREVDEPGKYDAEVSRSMA